MNASVTPVLLCVLCSMLLASATVIAGQLFGPKKTTAAKAMPYESGMDPRHDARRRFDVRFHLVAIAFLVFDVEVLFLYPWAVASHSASEGQPPGGIDAAIQAQWISGRGLVFGGAAVFFLLLLVGYLYDWRKGVFRWR